MTDRKMDYEKMKRLEEKGSVNASHGLVPCDKSIPYASTMSCKAGLVILRSHLLKLGKLQYTDTRNAERLLERYGTDIRYNADWKKWLVWSGQFWRTDKSGCYVHDKGIEMVRNMYGELTDIEDPVERLELEKFLKQSEAVRRREALIKAAAWFPSLNVVSEDLDPDPFLLSVKNGTINLATGEFKKHVQGDMITKIAPVTYDPDADCPTWKQFVCEIMDFKPELIDFLQRAAGWGITGDTSEQVMFILFGSGANGKSTFLNTIMQILGEYSATTPTETFMKQSGDKISNDLARLRGTRFVITSEAEQGRKLSEPLMRFQREPIGKI
jgi:putative DNA primase/helicase